eukprot:COSAG01_NODE_40220_length_466_cov_1.040872_1_plen_44_part_10
MISEMSTGMITGVWGGTGHRISDTHTSQSMQPQVEPLHDGGGGT